MLLTYAGNLENIADIEQAPNYTFIKEILDATFSRCFVLEHQFEGVIHLAESHVDRSITDPLAFVKQMLWYDEFVKCRQMIWKITWRVNVFIISVQMRCMVV
jgi:dTDP-glucose 4,6-dehydratase